MWLPPELVALLLCKIRLHAYLGFLVLMANFAINYLGGGIGQFQMSGDIGTLLCHPKFNDPCQIIDDQRFLHS